MDEGDDDENEGEAEEEDDDEVVADDEVEAATEEGDDVEEEDESNCSCAGSIRVGMRGSGDSAESSGGGRCWAKASKTARKYSACA